MSDPRGGAHGASVGEGMNAQITGSFVCERCGWDKAGDALVWRCAACGGPLTWRGPTALTTADLRADRQGLWRYEAALPVAYDPARSLGEPPTPLVEGRVGGRPALLKLDYLLPSGSFKDRGAAVLIGGLAALGVERVVEDSSGNAAAAIAAYSARAGLRCTIYAPESASAGKLVQVRAFGASLVRVPGPRQATTDAALAAVERGVAFYASHNWHPWFIEGVKTWAIEVWEQLGRLPAAVVAPVGSGSMILGAARAFAALRAGGSPGATPRLFAAQPAACAPVHLAFEAGADEVEAVVAAPTLAEGASIAHPVRGREVLRAVRASRGGTVAVSEAEIVAALGELWRQGFYVEPTAAVAAAGARQLRDRGALAPDEEAVVLLSGGGLKATERNAALLDAESREID
jgi:threonine synthase